MGYGRTTTLGRGEGEPNGVARHALNGLCQTCNHAHGCALNPEGVVVLSCDEFNDVGPVGMWTIPAPAPVAVEAPPSLGLCGDCARAENCHLPHAQQGVWHCAEYR
ncbi:hypothetical protein KKF91_13750 [Myxococcota bacterium]|nr:hypothetical protein [Myxococcota bacterium]MBU1431602.1 hypothetical protein [Myxococcota bacterium]MBU1900677.1 hypothetical protein [Myxococcota bacterium]